MVSEGLCCDQGGGVSWGGGYQDPPEWVLQTTTHTGGGHLMIHHPAWRKWVSPVSFFIFILFEYEFFFFKILNCLKKKSKTKTKRTLNLFLYSD